MPYGYLDTNFIDFPGNIDVEYVRGLQNAAGASFQDVIQDIDARLDAFNGTLPRLVADLVYPTTMIATDGTAPVAFDVTERGEYTMTRPQRTDNAGHMLPIRGYDVGVGFTEDGLEEMSQQDILNNVESMLLGYRNLYIIKALNRLMSDVEMRVDDNTNVTSPGFPGSGTGDNVFERSFPDGRSLPGGYTHYLFADTSVSGDLETQIDAAIDRLMEWQDPPFDMVCTSAMMDLVEDLPKFLDAGSELIRDGDDDDASVDPEIYAGAYGKYVRVRHEIQRGGTQANLSIFKTEGTLAEGNPLRWRYKDNVERGRNAVLRYRDFYPLSNAEVIQDFGIGVQGDRTGGINVYAANGASAYQNPTFN